MHAIVVEEQQTEPIERQEVTKSEPKVESRAPIQNKKKKSSNKLVIIIILLSLIPAVLVFIFLSRSGKSKEEPTPTPFVEGVAYVSSPRPERTPTPVPTPVPTSTPTPKPVDKSTISILVLNGTGKSGGAAFLKSQLEGLGYTDIEVGNAEKQDYEETEIAFSKEVGSSTKQEVTSDLSKYYLKVNSKTLVSMEDYDIKIITGLRSEKTPEPAASPTPGGSPSPTPTGSPQPTSTP
jgi:hypothetical protein